jgi:hypothetical protein
VFHVNRFLDSGFSDSGFETLDSICSTKRRETLFGRRAIRLIEPVERSAQQRVAVACGLFEVVAIEDGDPAALVAKQALARSMMLRIPLTVVRRAPIIWPRNSWVIWMVSLSTRSRIMSSQRASRGSDSWSLLQAAT